jgi:alpha-methylacyl-CoA racemase
LEKLSLDPSELPDQLDRSSWPDMKAKLQAIFSTKTQQEWTLIFDGSDACVTPVLSFKEPIPNSTPTVGYTNNQWPRQAKYPQPAPLLSRTPAKAVVDTVQENNGPFLESGKHSIEILSEFGISSNEIQLLLKSGALIDNSSKL